LQNEPFYAAVESAQAKVAANPKFQTSSGSREPCSSSVNNSFKYKAIEAVQKLYYNNIEKKTTAKDKKHMPSSLLSLKTHLSMKIKQHAAKYTLKASSNTQNSNTQRRDSFENPYDQNPAYYDANDDDVFTDELTSSYIKHHSNNKASNDHYTRSDNNHSFNNNVPISAENKLSYLFRKFLFSALN
jgi:hypothetical protein